MNQSERFRRENPFPSFTSQQYDNRRAKEHPGIGRGDPISEARPVYAHYKNLSRDNDRISARYNDTYEREERYVKSRPSLEREYYVGTTDGIIPRGHAELRGLADRVAAAEYA